MTTEEVLPAGELPPHVAEAATAGAQGSGGGAPLAKSLPVVFQQIALKEQRLVRLLFKAWTFIIVLGLLLAASVTGNIIQARRVGTVILLDKTTGVAVSVDNNGFGKTPAAEMLPDRPGMLEMKTAAKKFLESVYRIDPVPKVRLKEAAAGLKMMTPLSAVKYGNYIEENGIWNKQIAQSQEGSWTVKDENIKFESREPLVLSVYGEQRLKYIEGGATKIDTKQVIVPVTLMPDPEGRTERNFFTGFNVDGFGPEKVLSSTSEVQDSFTVKPPKSPSAAQR